LREVSKKLSSAPESSLLSPEAKAHAEEVSQRTREAEKILADIPNMMQLQDEDRYWRTLATQYSTERKLLTSRAAGIEKEMRVLDGEQARWQATSDQVRLTSGPEVVAERVRWELDAIEKLRSEAQEKLNLILTLQNRVSEQDRQIYDVLLKLED